MSEPTDDHHDGVDRPLSTGLTARAVVVAAAVTVLVGFGLGFGLGRRPSGDDVRTASPADTSTTTAGASPAGGPSTTSTTSTTAAPATTVATPTTTAAPTTSAAAPATVAPTTAAPPAPVPTSRPAAPSTVPAPVATTTTTRPAPAFLAATWTPDPQGRLVLPRAGSATFTLTNTGGLQTQWLLSGSGFSGPGGTMLLGILNPGESTTVTVVPASGTPAGVVTGTITVLGPNPLGIPFVVPA